MGRPATRRWRKAGCSGHGCPKMGVKKNLNVSIALRRCAGCEVRKYCSVECQTWASRRILKCIDCSPTLRIHTQLSTSAALPLHDFVRHLCWR